MSKKPIRRNRTGCSACKQRRRKCSEEKPKCLPCQRRGLHCEYSLQLVWSDDVVEILATDEFHWTQLPKRPATWTRPTDHNDGISKYGYPTRCLSKGQCRFNGVHFLHTSPKDISDIFFDSNMPLRSVSDQEAIPERPAVSSIPRSFTAPELVLDAPNNFDMLLLEYYSQNFCRRKVLVDSPSNEYRRVVLPMLHTSRALQHAVLAISAFDYSQIHHTNEFHFRGLQHKSQSLRLVREAVEQLSTSRRNSSITQSHADLDGTLIAILMLCISDITTGSTKEWITHLRGAVFLIESYGSSAFQSETVLFARHYFSLRDTFSSTALDTDSYFSERLAAPVLQRLTSMLVENDSDRNRINNYVGCSEELVSIISSITALAREKYRIRRTGLSSFLKEQEFLETATTIQCRLNRLEEVFTNGDESIVAVDDDVEELPEELENHHRIILFSRLYRRATHLYLRHAGFDVPVSHPSIQTSVLPSLLRLIQKVDINERSVYPMWPLFIASCMVVSEEDRRVVLDQFERLRTVWKLGNIGVTQQAVHTIWKWQDLAHIGSALKSTSAMAPSARNSAMVPLSNPNTRGDSMPTRLSLEWDEPLHRLGWRMSLT